MKIAENTTVEIDFTIKDAEGSILETTEESGPAVYIHGKEMMLQIVEDALLGKEEGENVSVSVSPEDGFGMRDESLIREIPRSDFADLGDIKIGDEFQSHDEEGNHMFVTVTEIGEDNVTVDANHPFADKTLIFDINVKSVRETTEEDIEDLFSHHHGDGCCGGDDMQDGQSCDHHGGCGCCGSH